MCVLQNVISCLQAFLISDQERDHNIIRKHTKKLNELGDISFPLNISNWFQYIKIENHEFQENSTVFDYKFPGIDKQIVINQLIEVSLQWKVPIERITLKNNDAHVYLSRVSETYKTIVKDVLDLNENYGSCAVIKNRIHLQLNSNIVNADPHKVDLSVLRLFILKDVAENLINFATTKSTKDDCTIYLVNNAVESGCKNVLCGPVINEKGVKSSYTGQELFEKRSSDMRMMAQHKYGLQVKPNLSWDSYFKKLGKASVTVEMLSNKPQKAIKISPYDLQSANKGASFIFYNCARLSALFKEFDKRISIKEYPELPDVDKIDFSVLNQPEEWELFYVYILQFPIVIKNCIKDIDKGILNPQHLVSFLSNLSSVFSVYYRRVRILTNPKEHMISVIQTRIYLLKALQCVFHNALHLLNIEPVREM